MYTDEYTPGPLLANHSQLVYYLTLHQAKVTRGQGQVCSLSVQPSSLLATTLLGQPGHGFGGQASGRVGVQGGEGAGGAVWDLAAACYPEEEVWSGERKPCQL